MTELHPHYDPLQYPLMFPNGSYGWAPRKYLLNQNNKVNVQNDSVSSSDDDDDINDNVDCGVCIIFISTIFFILFYS